MGTPPFVEPSAGTNQPGQPDTTAQLLAMIQKITQAQQSAQANRVGSTRSLPGQVGGAPPALASPLPQVGGGNMSTAAPVGPAAGAGTTPAPRNAPTPGGFQTGMEFSTSSGRNGAIVQGAIANVTQAVAAAKQEKQAHIKAQAENYMSQIMAAQQAGDKATLDLLLKDPKVIKTLEKGLDYIMPKTPGEPPPAEAQGIHAAMSKAQQKQATQAQQNTPLPAPNTPGGVAIPQKSAVSQMQDQEQLAMAKIRQAAIAGNPEMATMVALGISPTEVLKMDAEQRKEILVTAREMAKADAMLKGDIIKAGATKDAAAMRLEGTKAMVKMYRDYHKDKINELRSSAKSGAQSYAKTQMTTLKDMIDNLHTIAGGLEKDGKTDDAKKYNDKADDLQKQYQNISDSSDQSMEKMLQEMMGESKNEEQP